MIEYCTEKGIQHNFFAPRTPQQNGVVEIKNWTLVEAGRTLLAGAKLPQYLWAEAVATACYVQNRTLINKAAMKTPYELWRGRKPSVSHFRTFGCTCYVLNNGKDHLGKFQQKSDEAIFVGYSNHSKAYRVFNCRNLTIEESVHITFDESK